MKNSKKKVVIIGGGASGMMAAISAAKRVGGAQVCLLEKNGFLGRKLLATGNGRCNLTNVNCENAASTLQFFDSLGILHRLEADGRAYPYTEQAITVQQGLEDEIKNWKIHCTYFVLEVKLQEEDDGFLVTVTSKERPEGYEIRTEKVIIATGGKAGPQYGSTGDGYLFAKAFGHSMVKPIPSLVQITSEDRDFKNLKGVRAKGLVSIWKKGEMLDQEYGEIQFTETGVSGICVFNLSKYIRFTEADTSYADFHLTLDLMPEFSEEALKERLHVNLEKNLKGMVNSKLVPVLLSKAKQKAGKETIQNLVVEFLKSWEIKVSGTKGWKEAQVTSGGVSLEEINLKTMESKIKKGLYFTGEVVDFDGKCGGYNLQWAWESGLLAGNSI